MKNQEPAFSWVAKQSQPNTLTVRDVLQVLRKRKTTIWVTFGICFGLSVLAVLISTRRYESVATVEVNQQASDLLGIGSQLSGVMSGSGLDVDIDLQTQADVLSSEELVLQVVQQLDLERIDPDYKITTGWWTSQALKDEIGKPLEQAPIRRQRILKRFSKSLDVKVLPGTRIFEVHYLDQNPDMAAKVVNTLVDDYLARNVKVRYDATIQVGSWLSKELDQQKARVEEAEKKLADYQRETGLMAAVMPAAGAGQMAQTAVADIANNVVMQKFTQINQELTTAQASKMNAQAVYDLTKTGDPEVISTLTQTGIASPTLGAQANTVQSLRLQEAQLKSQLADLRTKYDVNYPRVVQTQQQLNDLQGSIKTEIAKISARAGNDLAEANAAVASLQVAYDKAKAEASKINDAATQFLVLSEEAASGRQLYEGLLSKVQEASVLAGLGSTNIDVVSPGRSTAQAAKPKIPLYLGLGAVMGLVLGCGLAFLRDELDNTILTAAQVEEVTTTPVLCSIPDPRSGGKKGYGVYSYGYGSGSKEQVTWQSISVSEHPKSTFAEVYRSLRSSILLARVDHQPQVIVVTSGLPGEGKSTTSRNLAAILAQNGSRVLLVHADMRRPSNSTGKPSEPRSSLSTVLSGMTDRAVPIPDPMQNGLFIMESGPRPPYPAELLGSKRAAELIDEWRTMYDYIVIDTPPLLLLTDAVILGRHADALILVVRYSRTTKPALRASLRILDGAHIPLTGIVINATNTSASEYTSYYGYGYAEYGAYASVSDSEDGGSNEK